MEKISIFYAVTPDINRISSSKSFSTQEDVENTNSLLGSLAASRVEQICFFASKRFRQKLLLFKRIYEIGTRNIDAAAATIVRVFEAFAVDWRHRQCIERSATSDGFSVSASLDAANPWSMTLTRNGIAWILKTQRDKVHICTPPLHHIFDDEEAEAFISEEQISVIKLVRTALKNGRAVYWGGFPELLADSFSRLGSEIDEFAGIPDGDRPAREAPASAPEFSAGSGFARSFSHGPVCQAASPQRGRNSDIPNFADMRLKEIIAFLKHHLGDEFSEAVLDEPINALESTPLRLVIECSDALGRIQIALGYRDPKTRRPLKDIPPMKL